MKSLTETHPHRGLANLLNTQAQDADLLNLAYFVARFLEKEWSVPINSAEVQYAIREWTKANRSPAGAPQEVTRLKLPGRSLQDLNAEQTARRAEALDTPAPGERVHVPGPVTGGSSH